MSFSFGFGGDGFDDSVIEQHNGTVPAHVVEQAAQPSTSTIDAYEVDLVDALASLPSSLQYKLYELPSETSSAARAGAGDRYPRRELHDIRAQIMAEADPSRIDQVLEAGLSSHGDLVSGVYEGGFKTWECSYDLAARLRRFLREDTSRLPQCFVELGAGTALPSSVVLTHLLECSTLDQAIRKPTVLVLADYNEAVLRLSTLPSVVLTWYEAVRHDHQLPSEETATTTGEEYIELTEQLKDLFRTDLHRRGIHVLLLAGRWGEGFTQVLFDRLKKIADEEGQGQSQELMIMASETIYSPTMTKVFSTTLVDILRNGKDNDEVRNLAFVAAKKLYFGVGGGVDDFKRVIGPLGASITNEWEGGQGVGRWLGQIQMKPARV